MARWWGSRSAATASGDGGARARPSIVAQAVRRAASPAAAAGRGANAQAGRWQRQLHASRRWATGGALLGAAAGAVLAAPANWLAGALAQASGQRLLLADARGSLWDGSAVLVLTGGAGSQDAAALQGRLAWSLRPGWQGLAPGLRLQARQDCCLNGALALSLWPSWNGYSVQLDNAAEAAGAAAASAGNTPSGDGAALGQWPAAWLAGLGAPFNTLALGGSLQLSSSGLRLQSAAGRLQLAGALQIDLLAVSSRVSPLPVLGSYRISLRGQPQPAPALPAIAAAPGSQPPAPGNSGASLQLQTLSGALLLSGNGQWTGGALRFRGQAEAAAGQEAVLGNLLNIIGRRQGALSLISIG